ncbi:unnamed protein product [Chilo suppressalis]|uniref:palmitoyl-protein hydrolase n=1 Tax=Chilo suppressalis TaxID=168631 RepID=A0ABN8L7Q4_CHISP|nr:unnamed protein product [Chilo suppressalis]
MPLMFSKSGTGENMKEWVRLMVDFAFPHINVVYPTAPAQPYTPAGGLLSNVWFDRADISAEVPERLQSIAEIEKEVRHLIQKENEAGIPSNRIIVGGFSMGGCLALHTAYRWVRDVAGVFAFSSFLNENSIVYEDLQKSQHNLPPLLQLHGNRDTMVQLVWGQSTFENLKKLGVKGEFHILDRLDHSINKRGMNIIKKFVEEQLPPI